MSEGSSSGSASPVRSDRRCGPGTPVLTAVSLAFLILTVGCAQHVADSQARQQAYSQGKDRVRLTTDAESVMGTCQYVRTIQPDLNRVPPTDAQLPDYYRAEAAYYGADTVLVKGRIGEAYVCGPSPLNPDGSVGTPASATPPPR